MSSASTSSGNSLPYKMRNLGQACKPLVEILLNDSRSSYIKTYSTMDKLEGVVSITAERDTRFEDIDITFTGTSKTYVEKMTTTAAVSGRSEARHQFLKLTQPIPQSAYPQPRILERGRTYKFPFLFVVPTQLLPMVCQHRVGNAQITEAHLKLPPSLGDPDASGVGKALLDDLAPDMAKISYAINAKVRQIRETGGKVSTVAEKTKKVRIVPASEEQPPLNVDEKDEDYALRNERTIRKGVFKGKLGRLVMEAAQPKSLRLPAPSPTASSAPVTAMTTVILHFDPAEENSPPPRLGAMSSKLKVITFSASSVRTTIPSRAMTRFDMSQSYYSESLSLSSRCMESVEWTHHSSSSLASSSDLERRDSAFSTLSSSSTSSRAIEASSAYRSGSYYTTRLLVPVTLPKNKSFVPTFHSCLISRTYSLDLHLSVNGTGVSAPSLTLKVPVQISAEASAEHWSEVSEFAQGAIEAVRESEQYFVPRSVAPPAADLLERGNIAAQGLPPSYSFFAPAVARVPVCV
ncbi:arrestin [Cryomyces antarcticus]